MSTSENPQVFLSYAHDDLKTVRRLYADLIERKVNVWFDKERMTPGRWKTQIQKAIPKSRYFLFCVSNSALQKAQQGTGFVEEELQQAYEIAMAQDERYFTILPVRLEECGRGDHRLSIYQQYDLFENWEKEIDNLAVYLGGEALTSKIEKRELSEDELLIDSFRGKAEAAYYANQSDVALPFYEVLISSTPDYAKRSSFHGLIMDIRLPSEETFEKKLSGFFEAIKDGADKAIVWNNKGATLADLGRHEEALFAFEEAIRLMPVFAEAWSNKGVALYNLGRHKEAATAHKKALKFGYEPG